MTEPRPFSPDWVSPPGDTISDLLEEHGWTQAELAERSEFTRKHINNLVKGRAPITPDTATRLSTVLGGQVSFWLTREAQYQAALERNRVWDELRQHFSDWLREVPFAWMVKNEWIRHHSHKGAKIEECLRFFGVASVAAWRVAYATPLTTFRASSNVAMRVGPVTAWLRKAELEATDLQTAPYSQKGFRSLLPELRALTAEPSPDVFVPELQRLCGMVGVAVVFVPAPPGCPAHGATRWLTGQKAMLALSLRYKTNDHVWFTFFHETGHVLKHAKSQLFIEGLDGLNGELEEEANRFARNLLIPRSKLRALRALRSKSDIEDFADELGVAPGIVVGRLQKEKQIPWSHMNGLKISYEWV